MGIARKARRGEERRGAGQARRGASSDARREGAVIPCSRAFDCCLRDVSVCAPFLLVVIVGESCGRVTASGLGGPEAASDPSRVEEEKERERVLAPVRIQGS